MKTFKKLLNTQDLDKHLCEAFSIPVSTAKDLNSIKMHRLLDKAKLKKLLQLLKGNGVRIPLVANEKGAIKVRHEKNKAIMKTNKKILDRWKKDNDVTGKVVDQGDGSIRGTGETKKLVNQGDVAEGIFAIILFMKFADIKLTEKNFNTILYKVKLTTEMSRKSSAKDKITLYINLAPKIFQDLTNPDPDFEDLRRNLFNSAVDYTTSKNINKYHNYFKTNGILDEIKIIADGLGGQTTTKTDIYVELKRYINDEEVVRRLNLNISLKAGSIKQFGQVSGSSYEHQAELWNTFGIDISSIEKKMNKLNSRGDVSDAIALAYKEAAKIFKSDFGQKTEDMGSIVKLFNSIIHHATLGENVELIQLDKGVFKRYTFKKTKAALKELAKKYKFTIENKMQSGQIPLPKLTIMMDGSPFLSIRSKSDMRSDGSFYARNYIEKEKQFTQIFGHH